MSEQCIQELKELENPPQPPQPRRIYIIRHGERVDLTFGYNQWIPMCFTPQGEYIRTDLNMPLMVPMRSTGLEGYRHDGPLTQVGVFQATLTGEALRDRGVKVRHAFAAPSLRCIQTLDAILNAMNEQEHLPMNIEPGFFEFVSWYREIGVPHWMTVKELVIAGFNINLNYRPALLREQLCMNETVDDFYNRHYLILKHILERTKTEGGDILIVGHASSLEVCTRRLVGLQPRSYDHLFCISQEVPYCALISIRQILENENNDENQVEWGFQELHIPNFTHSKRDLFNWNILVSPILMEQLVEKYRQKCLAQP